MKKISLFLSFFAFFVLPVFADAPLPADLEVRQLPVPPVVELQKQAKQKKRKTTKKEKFFS